MSKKKIFLTGGSGFIGKNILEQLGDKYIFLSPSRKELNLLDTGLTENFCRTHRPEIIIHSAKFGGTRKVPNTPSTAEINTRMFFNLVRNGQYCKKMIFLGSGAEYDVARPLARVKEDEFDQVVPSDSYGFYKYLCSKYIEKADRIINLRLFGIYGKYEDYELRFISNAICKSLFDLPITMRQNVFFEYVWIDDFVRILDYFIENEGKYKFYNIGRGKPIDLLTIAKLVSKIGGKDSRIIVDKHGLKNEYTCDSSRLRQEIPNLHFTDFEHTVTMLYQWYKTIRSQLKRESFLIDR